MPPFWNSLPGLFWAQDNPCTAKLLRVSMGWAQCIIQAWWWGALGQIESKHESVLLTNFRGRPAFALVGNKPYNLWGFMLIMHGSNCRLLPDDVHQLWFVCGLGFSISICVHLLLLLSLSFILALITHRAASFFPVTFDFSCFYWPGFNWGKKKGTLKCGQFLFLKQKAWDKETRSPHSSDLYLG